MHMMMAMGQRSSSLGSTRVPTPLGTLPERCVPVVLSAYVSTRPGHGLWQPLYKGHTLPVRRPTSSDGAWKGVVTQRARTASLATPGMVGCSATVLAMSIPITLTAGCSGAGLAVATRSTNLLTTEAAWLAASSVSPFAWVSTAVHCRRSLCTLCRRRKHGAQCRAGLASCV